MSNECEKHKGVQLTQMCETCRNTICETCKTEHDPNHNVFNLQELGNKLIMQLSKEDDLVLYQEICKLDDELAKEVNNLKTWFGNIEKKVTDVVHQCMNDVMNEVLEQTNVKLCKKRKQMEEALNLTTEDKDRSKKKLKTLLVKNNLLASPNQT